MQSDAPHPQECTARQTYHDATFLGIDAEGAAHYWSPYHQAAVVVDDGNAETWPLAETPCRDLAQWAAHVGHRRGWETGPRIGSITAELRRLSETVLCPTN